MLNKHRRYRQIDGPVARAYTVTVAITTEMTPMIPKITNRMRYLIFVLSLILLPSRSFGFSPSRRAAALVRTTTKLYSEAQTFSSIDSEESDEANNGRPNLQGCLANARWIEFALTDHKPLGCSVEESLASEPDGANYVFVSEVSYS